MVGVVLMNRVYVVYVVEPYVYRIHPSSENQQRLENLERKPLIWFCLCSSLPSYHATIQININILCNVGMVSLEIQQDDIALSVIYHHPLNRDNPSVILQTPTIGIE